MMLDKVNILEDSGPVAVNVSLSNVKIFGLDKCEVVENQVSAKDFSWITKIKIPKIRLEADYTMKGNILIISLNVSHWTREKKQFKYFLLLGSRQSVVWTKWETNVKKCKYFFPSFDFILATLKVKVYVTTKQYAKHDHTFFNITNCRSKFMMRF